MSEPVLHVAGDDRWVLGLSWLTFAQRPPAPVLDAALRNAQARFAALREGQVFQIGMTPSATPARWQRAHKSRLSALAATLAPLRQPPWRATFQLDAHTWWYLAVRDNYAIMQDGDVAGSRQSVGQARQRHDPYGGWADYSGDADSLSAMLSEAGPARVVLVRAHARPSRTLSVIALGVMLSSAVAYLGYHQWLADRLKADLRRAALAQIHAQAARIAPKAPPDHPANDVTAVPLSVFVRACVPGLTQLPLDHLGWSLQSAECAATGLQSTWSRGAYAADPVTAFGTGVALMPDGRAQVRTRMSMTAEPLPQARADPRWIDALMRFAHENGMDPQWNANPGTDQMAGMTPMTLSGPMPPEKVVPLLAQRSDVTLTRLSWSRERGWSYTILFPAPHPS